MFYSVVDIEGRPGHGWSSSYSFSLFELFKHSNIWLTGRHSLLFNFSRTNVPLLQSFRKILLTSCSFSNRKYFFSGQQFHGLIQRKSNKGKIEDVMWLGSVMFDLESHIFLLWNQFSCFVSKPCTWIWWDWALGCASWKRTI